MKKLALLLCTAVFVMVGCKKEDPEKPSDTPTQIDSALAAPIQNFPATAEVIYDAVIDIEGHHYDAVKIGDQIWMASNLRTARYANGDWIPEEDFVMSFTKPFRYKPSGDFALFGYLYNWSAVMHWDESSNAIPSGVQGVCPDGWHVPSAAEWEQLISYCSSQSECTCNGSSNHIAKSLAADHSWNLSDVVCAVGNDLNSNNYTGFSAIPVGYYCLTDYPDVVGQCFDSGVSAWYWCSSVYNYQFADVAYFTNDGSSVSVIYDAYCIGNSVRCVKD